MYEFVIKYSAKNGTQGDQRMEVAAKLQIKPGQKVAVVNLPSGVDLDVDVASRAAADAVLVFARNQAELKEHMSPAIEAARADRVSWIAYPKAGKLDTDLNRDILSKLMGGNGVRPVRQIAIDEIWSATRFRPGQIDG